MKAIAIQNGIYWVGAIDWNLRNFHGYSTPLGSTYNAYLLIDETSGQATLIDTVKAPFFDEMMSRIRSVIDPKRISQVISNHVEMDHSGSLPRLLDVLPGTRIFASVAGVKGLKEHYRKDWTFQEVKTGDTIACGARLLQVFNTPHLHWPDNMMVYSPSDRVLFSNDGFGQHLASSERFDDELDPGVVLRETQKYYANILMFSSKSALRALDTLEPLPLQLIAPSHGVAWRRNIPQVLEHYRRWASNDTKPLALVIYDTMWGSTELLAKAIVSGLEKQGLQTRLFNLHETHISDVMTDVLTANTLCIGSPTLNAMMMPTVAAFLTYLRGLSPGNRRAMAFGSFGWGGNSIGQIEEALKNCGFELGPSIRSKYIPSSEQLQDVTAQISAWAQGSERTRRPD